MSISLIGGEHFRRARWEFVMKANCRRVKLMQRHRVAKVVKKETRLLGYAIERKSFDSQTRFFGCAVTSLFRGAQLMFTPGKASDPHFTQDVRLVPARISKGNRQDAKTAKMKEPDTINLSISDLCNG
jgi:hypothetical protein